MRVRKTPDLVGGFVVALLSLLEQMFESEIAEECAYLRAEHAVDAVSDQ